MKYFKRILGALLLAIVPAIALVSVAHAQRFATTVEADQVVHSSLHSAGKNVHIKGEIFGDVFCVGQNVKVDAVVHGDVLCAGGDVTIAGKVDGNIRVAGQLVSISAEVGKNATVAGATISLDADAKVGQDFTVIGQSANIKGAVGRDVVANGTELIFNGKVGRNAKATSGNITLKEHAAIAGDFNYSSSQKIKEAKGATVVGDMRQEKSRDRDGGYSFPAGLYLVALVSMMLLLVVLALLFPRFVRRTSDIVRQNFLKSLALGFVAGFAIPVLCIGLGIVVVGIPLSVLIFLAFLVAVILAAPITAYFVGRLVIKQGQPLLTAVVGTAILVTTFFLPWIGIIFLFTAFWVGLGALLIEVKRHIGSASENKPANKTAK